MVNDVSNTTKCIKDDLKEEPKARQKANSSSCSKTQINASSNHKLACLLGEQKTKKKKREEKRPDVSTLAIINFFPHTYIHVVMQNCFLLMYWPLNKVRITGLYISCLA